MYLVCRLLLHLPPMSLLFPYTTLFRSYVEAALSAGLKVDEFAPRISFFFNAHNNLLEEVAKYRAARRLWARTMRDRFGARDPRSLMLRLDRKSTRLNSSHRCISYAVFCFTYPLCLYSFPTRRSSDLMSRRHSARD